MKSFGKHHVLSETIKKAFLQLTMIYGPAFRAAS